MSHSLVKNAKEAVHIRRDVELKFENTRTLSRDGRASKENEVDKADVEVAFSCRNVSAPRAGSSMPRAHEEQ